MYLVLSSFPGLIHTSKYSNKALEHCPECKTSKNLPQSLFSVTQVWILPSLV